MADAKPTEIHASEADECDCAVPIRGTKDD